ncbi:MAG: ABC transporter ATP-binding protein [Puniceicoccales bacterium]|jgi:ABC-type lipoprotein export system ATPase subunit|nr:ABC transporter ATP-binding protein [Puniceicoccales bacterium]
MSTTIPIISLEHISKQFPLPDGRSISVLEDISLGIFPQQTLSISGESGSGKSTLLHIIGGLDRATTGSLLWKGSDVSKRSMDQLASLRQNFLGFIFQGFHLIPELTVMENILLPVRIAKRNLAFHRERAQFLLLRLGIPNLSDRIPNLLSGGECQRVAIARALILNPELVIADEPTGNLDERNAGMVIELLLELCRENRSSLLLVTHNPAFAKKMQWNYRLGDKRLQSLG